MLLLVLSRVSSTTINCTTIQQANVVSGVGGLRDHGSTATVKFLGTFCTPSQCEAACVSNSTAADPCRSWAFYYPDTPQPGFASSCYGRHDDVWAPYEGIKRKSNHVCTAKSCVHPPLPPYATPSPTPAPLPPVPPVPPLPVRPLAPVDPERLPIMYLGEWTTTVTHRRITRSPAASKSSRLSTATAGMRTPMPLHTHAARTTLLSLNTSSIRAARCSSSARVCSRKCT